MFEALFASRLRAGGKQRDGFDPDLSVAVDVSCGDRVKGLALRSADGQTDQTTRSRYRAKILTICIEDLRTGGCRDVKAAFGVEAASIAARTLPLCEPGSIKVSELPLVTQLTISAHVENDEGPRIRDDYVLLIGRQNNPVGPQGRVFIFCILLRNLAIRGGVIKTRHGDVDTALAVRNSVIQNAAYAIQGIAIWIFICEDFFCGTSSSIEA